MVVLEKSPKFTRSPAQAELHVERTDIAFDTIEGNKVRIQVRLQNIGETRSNPTTVRIESAPLGGFVSWKALKSLPVPSLEPGESIEVSTEVDRPQPKSLGNFEGVRPKRIITALSAPDQPAPQTGVSGLLGLLRWAAGGTKPTWNKGSLAPDIWDLVGRGQPYWAGNINVFVGNRAVERHLAKALRIHPGRTNLAMFMVGNHSQPDAYAFELEGLPGDWVAQLYNMTNQRSLLPDANDALQKRQWVEANGGLMIMLATEPPADCRKGKLEVHVTRRSTGETAMVEFDLDPAAQGRGCYCV